MRDELKDRAISLLKDTWAQGYEAGVHATNVDCGVVWEERIEDIKADIEENISHYEHFSSPNTANGLNMALQIIDKHCGGDADD